MATKPQPDEPRCERCGEDRLLDTHKTYFVCQVCAHRWMLIEDARDVSGNVMTDP